MYCPNCGTKNEDTAMFCGECGTSLKEYQDTGYENYQQVTVTQKKMSKQQKIIALEIVLAVVLIIGIVFSLNQRFSPERVVLNYWKVSMEHNWSQAYEYCSLPKDSMLSKEMYVNAHDDKTEIKDYRGEKVKEITGYDNDEDIRCYTVEYLVNGSANKEQEEIKLIKGKKQFFFWNQWEVVPENEWIENVEIRIPSDASLKLNGVQITGDFDKEQNGVTLVSIPYLFKGSYQMEVAEDGMKTLKENVLVDDNGFSTQTVTLVPTQEEMEKLVKQYSDSLKNIIESAIAKKSFQDVKAEFISDTSKRDYIRQEYEQLARIKEEDSIIDFSISGITAYLNNWEESGELTLGIQMNLTKTEKSFWGDEEEKTTQVLEKDIFYQKEDGKWKLEEMPITYYDILY